MLISCVVTKLRFSHEAVHMVCGVGNGKRILNCPRSHTWQLVQAKVRLLLVQFSLLVEEQSDQVQQ